MNGGLIWPDLIHSEYFSTIVRQLLQQADLDKTYLAEVLQRHKLKLPTL